MAFPLGNRNGRTSLYVTEALRRAVQAEDGKLIRRACNAVLNKAAKGDLGALAWIADRLDGRVLPQLPDQGDGQLVISWITAASSMPLQSSQVIEHEVREPASAYVAAPQHEDARVPSANGNGSHPSK